MPVCPQIMSAFFQLIVKTDWLGERHITDNHSDAMKTDKNNLIRKAPSEAYKQFNGRDRRDYAPRGREVLIMPSTYGESQQTTIAKSKLADLYKKQTKESPISSSDPETLLSLYQQRGIGQVHSGAEVPLTYSGPVLLDSTMTYNFLGRLSPSFIRGVQRDAQRNSVLE